MGSDKLENLSAVLTTALLSGNELDLFQVLLGNSIEDAATNSVSCRRAAGSSMQCKASVLRKIRLSPVHGPDKN